MNKSNKFIFLLLSLEKLHDSCKPNSFFLVKGQPAYQSSIKQQAKGGPGRKKQISTKSLVSSGLQNLGNTCYLNAQLQCAFHIPFVRNLILGEQRCWDDAGHQKETDYTVGLSSLRKVFSLMSSPLPATPLVLCENLGINVYEQQDSQEFWKLLLPTLELPKLNDLYQGSFEDYIVAQDGSGRERRKEEPFLDLSLEVQSGSVIKSMMETFSQPELLSEAEGNGWRPEKGADKVDALKGSLLRVQGLSSILQLHLKRFQYDWNTDLMSKINDPFTFPEELDLSSVCKDIQDVEVPFAFYDLQSVVVHAGGYGNGHYYSYVRPDLTSSSWYRFDDDRVSKVKFSDVIRDSFGGRQEKEETNDQRQGRKRGFWGKIFGDWRDAQSDFYGYGGRHSSAYMLQYVRRCDVPTLYEG